MTLTTITVRMDPKLHAALKEEAHDKKTSLNLLCVEKLKLRPGLLVAAVQHSLKILQYDWTSNIGMPGYIYSSTDARDNLGSRKEREDEILAKVLRDALEAVGETL